MTLSDFLNVLNTKAQVSIVDNESDKEVLNVKNDTGVVDNISTSLASATIKRVNITGVTAVTVVIETVTTP